MNEEEDTSSKIMYFLFGLGFGVAVGLLFAPKSGAEARELILTKADEGKKFLLRQSARIRDTAADVLKKGKNVVSRQKDQTSAASETGKQSNRGVPKEGGEGTAAPQGV